MSFGEIFLILFVILLFFGSKSIPKMARTLGRAMREVKNATNDIQREIRDSANNIQEDLNVKSRIQNSFKLNLEDEPTPRQREEVQRDPEHELANNEQPQELEQPKERKFKIEPPKNSQPRVDAPSVSPSPSDEAVDQDSD